MIKIGRSVVFAALVLLLSLSLLAGSWAQGRIRVTVDGDDLAFDQPPVMLGASVLVPLRGVFERLGAQVEWEAATRTITATRYDTQIVLRLGSSYATVNGEGRTLQAPAASIGGRTMVPLRFVSEALDANVQWQANSRTVVITSGLANQPPPVNQNSTTTIPSATLPRIDSVTHSANAALRPGDTLTVTLRGEPGDQATFDLFGVAQNVAMREVYQGTYEGSVQIPTTAPNANSLAVLGRLTRGDKQNLMGASSGVSVLAQAAAIARVMPGENSTVKSNRPNILVVFNLTGGIRILPESLRLLVNGQDVTSQASVSEDVVSYAPQNNLSNGSNTVYISLRDIAGNTIQKQWNFNVQPGGTIQSVTHNAYRPLVAGETLTVTMIGDPNGTAVFDIGSYRTGIAMNQISSGNYRGSYLVQSGDNITNAYIVGRLTLSGQSAVALSSTTSVSLGVGSNGSLDLQITSPQAGQSVGNQFTIAGRASPYSTVSLSVKISASSFLNFGVNLLDTQVQADESGNFSYQFNGYLPFSGGEFTITAVARNASGVQSQPVSVTVTRS